jgi:hypothetical protein
MRDLQLRPAQRVGRPHEGAAALPPADQPVLLQRGQGRPDRGPADPEALHQRQLRGQPLVGGDVAPLDVRPQHLLDLVAQGNRRVVRDRGAGSRGHLSAKTYNQTSSGVNWKFC